MNLVNNKNATDAQNHSWLDLVHRQVASLRFGIVQIVVHDSHIIQIDRTEKLRLDHSQRTHHLPC